MMLFVIQPVAVDGTERVLDALDAILVRVEHDVHEMEIVLTADLDASKWYESSRRDRRKVLEEIVLSALYRSPRTQGPHLKRIEVHDEASAEQARSLAYTPLIVIAENDVSDGALIEAAVRVLGAPQTVAVCFGAPSQLDPPGFQIESRGGHGELPKLLASTAPPKFVGGQTIRESVHPKSLMSASTRCSSVPLTPLGCHRPV